MASFSSSSISCGIVEAYYIYEYKTQEQLDQFFLSYWDYCVKTRGYQGLFGLVMFSGQASVTTFCSQLAETLRKKWGEVQESKPVINPTHNTEIKVWIWYPNETCVEHVKKLVLARDGKVAGGAPAKDPGIASRYIGVYNTDRKDAESRAKEWDRQQRLTPAPGNGLGGYYYGA